MSAYGLKMGCDSVFKSKTLYWCQSSERLSWVFRLDDEFVCQKTDHSVVEIMPSTFFLYWFL